LPRRIWICSCDPQSRTCAALSKRFGMPDMRSTPERSPFSTRTTRHSFRCRQGQTQRALGNFRISGLRPPRAFLRALGLIKRVGEVNGALGALPADPAQVLAGAAQEVADGSHDPHFPLDVFQTGSGTSTKMNANEVIARLASRRLGRDVHPNERAIRGMRVDAVVGIRSA
jgi:hypothetical protein